MSTYPELRQQLQALEDAGGGFSERARELREQLKQTQPAPVPPAA